MVAVTVRERLILEGLVLGKTYISRRVWNADVRVDRDELKLEDEEEGEEEGEVEGGLLMVEDVVGTEVEAVEEDLGREVEMLKDEEEDEGRREERDD